MSRDWSPRQLYYADVRIFKEKGIHLYDADIYFVDKDGNKVGDFIDNSLKNEYPTLYFLFDNLKHLKKEIEENKTLFGVIERQLKKITEFDKNSNFSKDISELGINKCLKEWYEGRYCGRFYYNTENNENLQTLIEYAIKEKMMNLPEIDYQKLDEVNSLINQIMSMDTMRDYVTDSSGDYDSANDLIHAVEAVVAYVDYGEELDKGQVDIIKLEKESIDAEIKANVEIESVLNELKEVSEDLGKVLNAYNEKAERKRDLEQQKKKQEIER